MKEYRLADASERQLKAITALLSLQFILGVVLATLIDYDPHKPTAAQTTFLVLHIIGAVALLAAAVVRIIYSIKMGSLLAHSTAGLASVIGLMIAGGIAAGTGNDVAVFIMSLGFIFAFGAYGYSLSALRDIGRAPTRKK